MRGMCFGLDDATAQRLLTAADDAARDEIVEDIEDRMWGAGLVLACELDKAWDPISCALCPQAYAGGEQGWWSNPDTWPARGVVLGYQVLNADLDAGLLTYNRPAHVAEVSAFLEDIDEDRFLVSYREMPEELRNPEYGTTEAGYAWDWLSGLKTFYAAAAKESRHVIFSVNF